MKVKDQIRARRDQLGVTVAELARRIGVCPQSVRHWEAGRSFPGKSKAPRLEDALSFRLDWTEGVKSRVDRPDIMSLLDDEDIKILLVISRLPVPVKRTIQEISAQFLAALDGRGAFVHRESERPPGPFVEGKRNDSEKTRKRVSHRRAA